MSKKKVIPVTCTSTHQIEVDNLQAIQGNLKSRTREQLQNLRAMILKYGFSFPIYVWQDGETNFTLDGHGRDFVSKELVKEGYRFDLVVNSICEKLNLKIKELFDYKIGKGDHLVNKYQGEQMENTIKANDLFFEISR